MSDRPRPRLIAHTLSRPLPDLRPGSPRRAWMDDSPSGFAYRCLPLTIANAHGWEIGCPVAFEAEWNGGQRPQDVVIRGSGHRLPVAHFGSGVITFHVEVLFRTDPGWSLFVSGPPNAPKDGIAPLTGIVETDWAPMSFTMNWRFTRPGHAVRFVAGEAFCFVFPLPRFAVSDTVTEVRALEDDPALAEAHAAWRAGRSNFNAELLQPGTAARDAGWQREYHQGRGAEPGAHLTRIAPMPFRRP